VTRRCILSATSTQLWRAGHPPTVARLVWQAQRAADRTASSIVLVAPDGVVLRTFRPLPDAVPTQRIPVQTLAEVADAYYAARAVES
jgi:hypothetical protein